MKILLITLGWLLCLILMSVGAACCKAAGDAETDAERCFEAWMKSKQDDAVPDDRKEEPYDAD